MKAFKLGIVAVLFLIVVGNVFYYLSNETVTIKVNDKERVTETNSNGNVSSYYLVMGEKETFKNTDSWMFLKFNSSDVQGKLKENKIYIVEVAGWRVPFLSWYRNIIKVD